MAGYAVRDEEVLFIRGDLRAWLEQRRSAALDAVRAVDSDEMLARPPEQIAEEILERHRVPEPRLGLDAMTGDVNDQRVDVSGDFGRMTFDRDGPVFVDGTRITLRAPYQGADEVLRLRATTFSPNPPRAKIGKGCVSVSRDIPADVLERDREKAIESLRNQLQGLGKYLGHSRADIAKSNAQMGQEVREAAEKRRQKILTDRDTEAMLGVPLHRDQDAAKTYSVQPVTRRRVKPRRVPTSREAFAPEPAITDEDFADIVGDISNTSRIFERLAVTYAEMDEERLRDQILAMLGNVYGPASGETFSRRGKTDIYLPWEGGAPVFLAECKWWRGSKAFRVQHLPQLLDRYVVWRDTHTAMVLFVHNKDVTAVINAAEKVIREHDRYLRDDPNVGDVPVFVLHKDGDSDREIKLALVTVALRA